MPEWGVDDRENWQNSQLQRAQVPERISMPVRQLLQTWKKAHFNIEDGPEVVRLFAELALEHSLPAPTEPMYAWVECRPGQIRVADVIRIKGDAFKGEAGKSHNGRVGKIVAIRSGDIIVNLTDEGPEIKGAHYSPYVLEKRVLMPTFESGAR